MKLRPGVTGTMRLRTTKLSPLLEQQEMYVFGVRILGRLSFALIIVLATFLNEADQLGRAQGLISVRVEAPTMLFGTHACMQPEPEDLPPEPSKDAPPCPKKLDRRH